MKIAEMLVRQMAESKEFSRKNFGLATGSGYPELVRECLAEDAVAVALVVDLLKFALSSERVTTALKNEVAAKSPSTLAASDPLFYETAMNFFYWGIQIGRMLEREEAKALQSLAKEA